MGFSQALELGGVEIPFAKARCTNKSTASHVSAPPAATTVQPSPGNHMVGVHPLHSKSARIVVGLSAVNIAEVGCTSAVHVDAQNLQI